MCEIVKSVELIYENETLADLSDASVGWFGVM